MERIELKNLSSRDSVILGKFSPTESEVLFDHNPEVARTAASITKVLFGAEIARMLRDSEIENTTIRIAPEHLAHEGTDVLADLYNENNRLSLDVQTLVRLMVKYSCNSSTIILDNLYLRDREKLEQSAKDNWGMQSVHLQYKGEFPENEMSVQDLFVLYKRIYTDDTEWLDVVRTSLKESRNIYRLFDQQGVKVLGSKSGTIQEGGSYWIGDTGVVEINGNMFFLGAILRDPNISDGVTRIRQVGDALLDIARNAL